MSELRGLVQHRANAGNEPLCWHLVAWSTLIGLAVTMVLYVGSTQQLPMDGTIESSQSIMATASAATLAAPAVGVALATAAPPPARKPVCGDGICEPEESMSNCMADCPGVTTEPQCGEEPHSDPGGFAVVWGASHKTESAAACCAACAAHAANPKNAKRPCNSCERHMNRRVRATLSPGPVDLITHSRPRGSTLGGRGVLPLEAAVLVSRHWQLAWIWRVLAEVAGRPSAPPVRPAWQVHRRVPTEALDGSQDGQESGRHATQSDGTNPRAVDRRGDGDKGGSERQVGDRTRRVRAFPS